MAVIKKEKTLLKRLLHRYRFVILNDETYEEKASFLLSGFNLFVAVSTIAVINITITTLVIIYTPLKQYIPGYGDYGMRSEIKKMMQQTDDLEGRVEANDKWVKNVKTVLSGDIKNDSKFSGTALFNKLKEGAENITSIKGKKK